ncbi:dihydrodipicolinate synthase family protein [Planctomycetota bacterium]
MKYFGVLVPIVTPCSKDGKVDTQGLKSVCDDMLNAGCAGIFICGSTGRGPWFSRKDKITICKTAAEHIGDVPLYAGCMANSLEDMLENTQLMADAGAQFAVLTSPGYFNYNMQEIETIFTEFADRSPLPVVIYDIPVFTGAKLETAMLSRLAKHEKVVGFKDSSSDFERFKELIDLLGDDKEFLLIQGKEHLIADTILAGGSAMTASLLHINPRPFVKLCNAAHAGDAETAQSIQKECIDKLFEITNGCFDRRGEISTLFFLLNACLKKRGVCENILMPHEGECPDWIEAEADKAVEICKRFE